MAENLDVVVVGAGVVGLAVARCLALNGRAPVVLEREDRVGLHSGGRNKLNRLRIRARAAARLGYRDRAIFSGVRGKQVFVVLFRNHATCRRRVRIDAKLFHRHRRRQECGSSGYVLGIDSPGLTASLAIAEHIRRFL